MGVPIRVAHVMGKMVGGGVEQVVMNYYRHIDRSRVQFDFLVDADSTLVPREEIDSLGGRIFTVPPYQHAIAYQRELTRLFRREHWPIVHSHVNALSVFPLCAAKRAGVPVRIAHSHSTSGRGEPAKNAAKAVLRRFSNVYPTYRMACSRYAGEWLFGIEEPFEVVPNAIELEPFSFNARSRELVRAELGVASSDCVIGHVGRFTQQKNQSFLIQVFNRLHNKMPNVLLALVGEGGQKGRAEELIEDLGLTNCVRLLGQRDDINEIYQAFDVFCLPSIYEGLGMVAIEAQVSGLPCVVSTHVPSEVNLTGNVEFLPLDSSDEWADSIANAARRGRMGANIRSFSRYDINTAAVRLQARYLELGEAACL